MNYQDSYISADIAYGNDVIFTENSVEFSGRNTEFDIDMVFNDEKCCNNWFDISVSGICNRGSLKQENNGYILTTDKKIPVTVSFRSNKNSDLNNDGRTDVFNLCLMKQKLIN